MSKKRCPIVNTTLNPVQWRWVKIAAAKKGQYIGEFCQDAILVKVKAVCPDANLRD